MTLRPRRAGSARSAFTLTEILVVMGIIVVLMSLLMAAVQKARESGKRTQAHTEMREFGASIGLFKQKYTVDYIPSKLKLCENWSQYSTNANATLDIDSQNWLKNCWPNLAAQVDWNGDGDANDQFVLEGDQCLVFALGGLYHDGQMIGFSTNPTNPANRTSSNRVGPFAQFQPDRLVVIPGGNRAAGYPSYIDPWKKQPYAYFSNYGKLNSYNKYYGTPLNASPLNLGSDCSYIAGGAYSTGVNRYLNENGFQIICAGSDKEFGPGGTTLPATGVGEDDMANFSQSTLGGGVK